MKKTLHITNGNSLTNYLHELDFEGDFLTWQEMLCEGPTEAGIDSKVFIKKRKQFLNDFYNIEINEQEFIEELQLLDNSNNYDEIILWFEYDLFCHINLIAVLSLIHQREITSPLYLVCSGRIEGEIDLKGLSELSSEQLMSHYKNKIILTNEDKNLALTLWRTYCGKDHNLFKPYITQKSSFKYLSNCLKAHLKRFPDAKTGLNDLEHNVLEIIKSKEVKSRNHLLGYVLNYQGYYGYGDLQILRMIDKLSLFFDEKEHHISLNRKGHEALLGIHNFSSEINNNLTYGGVNRLDFLFYQNQNKLIKTNINAN